MRGVLLLRLWSWARDADVNTSAVNISTIVTLTWAGGRSLQVISVVMPELSVAVCVVFRFGGVGSGGSHPVQIKLVMVRVHGLSVRLVLIIFVLAVCRLSAVIAHIRHRRLGESRGVLGVRVATHRSWKIGQNASNLLLIGLSGAHGKNKPPRWGERSAGGVFPSAERKAQVVRTHRPIILWNSPSCTILTVASLLGRPGVIETWELPPHWLGSSSPSPPQLLGFRRTQPSAISYAHITVPGIFDCTSTFTEFPNRRSDRFSVRSLLVGTGAAYKPLPADRPLFILCLLNSSTLYSAYWKTPSQLPHRPLLSFKGDGRQWTLRKEMEAIG